MSGGQVDVARYLVGEAAKAEFFLRSAGFPELAQSLFGDEALGALISDLLGEGWDEE